MNCCSWKEKYRIVEEMLVTKMIWAFTRSQAKRLIQADIKEALKKGTRAKTNPKIRRLVKR